MNRGELITYLVDDFCDKHDIYHLDKRNAVREVFESLSNEMLEKLEKEPETFWRQDNKS